MKIFKRLSFYLLSYFLVGAALACTDIRVQAKDGTVLVARTMEYAVDMHANLRTSNRERNFTTTTPDGKPGLAWTAKYGYVFFDAFNIDAALDGMNEQGLSFEALYLPGLAQYQTIVVEKQQTALPYLAMGDWILGNFASVDEVKAALKNIVVYAQKTPGMGDMIFPLHFSVYDAGGKGLVIEYINGQLYTHDNKVGVLTNSPDYAWQVTNLYNYLHLNPFNPVPTVLNGVGFAALGEGLGMVGLPGDISAPSRFVKMATLLRTAVQANDAPSALNLAAHVINNVDIPLGLVRESRASNVLMETTQWTVFKDLTHKMFYFHTYANLQLRAVTLDKIDFSKNSPRLKMPIASNQAVEDVTTQLVAYGR